MFIFHYDSKYCNNLIKFKNDLYVCLNTFGPDELSEDSIHKYTNEFVKYFNQIYTLIENFENDIENLKYNVEFKIIFNSNIPIILLNSICLAQSHLSNLTDEKLSSKIKKSDYDKLTNFLDFNYEITVSTNPYYIVTITNTNNAVYYDDFYIGKLILLKNINTSEAIEINFDSNLLFIYDLDELDRLDDIEPNGFKFYNGKLIIYDGPVFKIKKLSEPNLIGLDEQIYLIDPISTIDINQIL